MEGNHPSPPLSLPLFVPTCSFPLFSLPSSKFLPSFLLNESLSWCAIRISEIDHLKCPKISWTSYGEQVKILHYFIYRLALTLITSHFLLNDSPGHFKSSHFFSCSITSISIWSLRSRKLINLLRVFALVMGEFNVHLGRIPKVPNNGMTHLFWLLYRMNTCILETVPIGCKQYTIDAILGLDKHRHTGRNRRRELNSRGCKDGDGPEGGNDVDGDEVQDIEPRIISSQIQSSCSSGEWMISN